MTDSLQVQIAHEAKRRALRAWDNAPRLDAVEAEFVGALQGLLADVTRRARLHAEEHRRRREMQAMDALQKFADELSLSAAPG